MSSDGAPLPVEQEFEYPEYWHGKLDERRDKSHSGFGIWSFALALVCDAGIAALIIVAGFMEASNPGGIDETSTEAIVLGLALFAAIAANFVALGLGIAGIAQSDKKKAFAILGIVFSSVGLVIFALLFMLGSSLE